MAGAATGTRQAAQRTPWLTVNGLGLFTLVMYGVTYYGTTTAAPSIAREFGIAASTVFGIFSGGFLVTAFLAPRFGRWTQVHGSGRVLVAGVLIRTAAVMAMALAPDIWTFAAALVLSQIVGQLTEYDAAFAAAVELLGDNARTAISQITLWGGLASTAFWPLTTFLLDHMTWRGMLLIYAAVMLVLCLPLAVLVVLHTTDGRRAARAAHHSDDQVDGDRATAAPPTLVFITLAAAFALAGIAYSLPTIMLPVLDGLGLGGSGLVAGMLFGPSQTAGRFFDMIFARRIHALAVAVIATAMLAASLFILLYGGATAWSAVVFAILYGAGAGVSYIVRGSVVLALYGRADYPLWLGRLGAVRLIVSACAPFVLALLLEHQGAASVVLLCAVTATLATALFFVLERRYA